MSRRTMCRIAAMLAIAVLLAGSPILAQQYDGALYKGMKYRLIGPYRGGRSLTAVGVPSQPHTYYFGAVAGGVWKTTNGGMTWIPVFDKQAIGGIGSVAVAASDPNILYVGTGEACIRGNITHGDGVYKSTDAGKTWTHVGLRETRHIARVLIHPRNPDNVYVGALGHAYGNNPERGVFRTLDGGKTWEKVLYRDEKTGISDLAMDPSNPAVLFAAMWEAGRTPWSMTSGGPGSGLYKSTDGGTTWKQIKGKGWPEAVLGKIGVSVSGANPNRVYVILEALEEIGGFYRSDDGGEAWQQMTDDHRLRHRPWYYTHVTADTKNADTVYVLNVGMYKSTDGGKSWNPMGGIPHGDHHGLWIDPENPKRMINADDGGATITVDGGETWSRQDNQPTAQFYHVTTDNQFPYRVYGSQQDNTSVSIASRSNWGSIGRNDWDPVGGGEAGYIAPHPTDPTIVYAGEYFGILTRFDRRTAQAHNISVWPDDTDGYEAAHLKYRFNWTEPIHVSVHDPNVVFYTGNHVFKSTSGGAKWDVISPDLTRNDKSKQGRSGGPVTGENISIEYYNVIFSFAESRVQKDLLWAGTDDGLVHLTRDGGKNWSNVTPKDLPEGMVSILDASAHSAGTAYFALDRHKFDDLRPYIHRTHDFGKTWTRINSGIPDGTFVRAVREDPARKGLLYAGTETGIYVSFDDGARWQSLQLNLPVTPIHDLVVKDHDLVVATHGRSFWILDDLAPLRQMGEEVAQSDVHLFTPSAAWRIRTGGGSGQTFTGENPPNGAVIYYSLKIEQKEEITLEILDASSKTIRKYSSKEKIVEGKPLPERPQPREKPDLLPAAAGMHRFVWNLRYELPELVPGAIWDMGPPDTPLALPGKYTAKLNVGGKSFAAAFEVKRDPRVTTSRADLEIQFAHTSRVMGMLGAAHNAVTAIRDLRQQLGALRKRLSGDAATKDIVAATEAIEKKMAPVEAELIEVKAKSSQDMCNYPTKLSSKLAWLSNVTDSADFAPTHQSAEFTAVLQEQLDGQMAKWKEIVSRDVAALNEQIRKANIPGVSVR